MNDKYGETQKIVTGRYQTKIYDIPILSDSLGQTADALPYHTNRFRELGKQIEQNQANDPTSLEALQINALHQLVNIQVRILPILLLVEVGLIMVL